MNINIAIKSAAKTRNIKQVPYEVSGDICNLKDLIINLVNIEIDKYENHTFKVLSQEDINTMVDLGKISFGFKYREHDRVNREEAVNIALLAFEDGLFVVFINDVQVESLTNKLVLNDNDVLSFIRLTMLSGRYF